MAATAIGARHASHDETCAVCSENCGERPMHHGIVFQNSTWLLRHSEPPYGVPGWLTLQAKRHVSGPAAFDDVEAASFGPTLRHISAVLLQSSEALRVYTAALGEAYPHFHCHLVPRYEEGPKGWALFGQQAEAAAGRVHVSADRVNKIVESVRDSLAAQPPPHVQDSV